ncbi:MAG: hypothetical protein MJE77_00750 [Proteobacteria bacterium]|nr:hypothetical protein [Pseudomonadota bacterium]
MNRFVVVLCIGVMGASSVRTARADDDKGPAPNRLGIDVMLGQPVGDIADAAGTAIGGLLRYQHRFIGNIAVTGRVGYIRHGEKNSVTLGQIPLFAGIEYYLSKFDSGLFIVAEAGLNNLRTTQDLMGDSTTDSENEIGVNVGAGYAMGALTVRGSLLVPSLGDVGDGVVFAATVGYRVTSF